VLGLHSLVADAQGVVFSFLRGAELARLAAASRVTRGDVLGSAHAWRRRLAADFPGAAERAARRAARAARAGDKEAAAAAAEEEGEEEEEEAADEDAASAEGAAAEAAAEAAEAAAELAALAAAPPERRPYLQWRAELARMGPQLLAAGAGAGGGAGLFARAHAATAALEAWLRANLPSALPLLAPATPREVAAAERRLGTRFPPPLRAVLLASGGQRHIPGDPFRGALGGLVFYDVVGTCELLPLAEAVEQTLQLRAQRARRAAAGAGAGAGAGTEEDGPERAVLARCFVFAKYVGQPNGKFVDCARPEAPVLVHDAEMRFVRAAPRGAGLIEWLEAFVSRLGDGTFAADPLPLVELGAEAVPQLQGVRYVCLNPRRGAGASRAVTRGISVEMGAAFVPRRSHVAARHRYRGGADEAEEAAAAAAAAAAAREEAARLDSLLAGGGILGALLAGVAALREAGGSPARAEGVGAAARALQAATGEAHRAGAAAAAAAAEEESELLFTYRCRLSNDGSELPSAQLTHRTWLVARAPGAEPERVHGPGVVGLTPVLRAGDAREFTYASCTTSSEPRGGSMEGSLRFVPGTAARPLAGEATFEAVVARFDFEVGDFIFA